MGQQTILRKVLPEKKEDYDFTLISRYGVLGTAVFPPILFYWYKWLDGRFVGTAVKTIATKVVFDQAVSAPIILGLFYIGMSLMEGRPDIFQELREKFMETFKVSDKEKRWFQKMHEKENHSFKKVRIDWLLRSGIYVFCHHQCCCLA